MPPSVESTLKKALTPLLLQLYSIAEILELTVTGLTDTNEKLAKWETRQAMKERQNNAVFKGKGLGDSRNETSVSTMARVKELLTKMGMNGAGVKKAVRLGKYRPGFNRPVLCEFETLNEKQQAMRSRRELKGTDVWINNDLPYTVRMDKNRARKEALESRQERAVDRRQHQERDEPRPSTSIVPTGTASTSVPTGTGTTKEKNCLLYTSPSPRD